MEYTKQTSHGLVRLVKPSVEYQDSYIAALAELVADKNRNMSTHSDFDSETETFPEYIDRLHGYEQGNGLPEGYVPDTILWLVDDQNEWLGKISIRHELTEYLRNFGGSIGYEIRPTQRKKGYGSVLLELGLQVAKDLNLEEIIITCDSPNIASKRIIEKNGGQFLEELDEPGSDVSKRRYVLEID